MTLKEQMGRLKADEGAIPEEEEEEEEEEELWICRIFCRWLKFRLRITVFRLSLVPIVGPKETATDPPISLAGGCGGREEEFAGESANKKGRARERNARRKKVRES
ncbi:small subunit processome component 20 homolog [Striga asiatica]|uniref:Small subunit processome component 20 homolog n=1 Tax=Striga asiatica TaxID=4170 RepID=A0A5A7PAU1_STRAF|nr:small subunit processome component 20 homolog [Striga asiatica]